MVILEWTGWHAIVFGHLGLGWCKRKPAKVSGYTYVASFANGFLQCAWFAFEAAYPSIGNFVNWP